MQYSIMDACSALPVPDSEGVGGVGGAFEGTYRCGSKTAGNLLEPVASRRPPELLFGSLSPIH